MYAQIGGVVEAIGLVAVFVGLIGASVSALSNKRQNGKDE
jgi:hypothetical protein